MTAPRKRRLTLHNASCATRRTVLHAGDITLSDADGDLVERGTRYTLCRCGHSGNKPFCDNGHLLVGLLHPNARGFSQLSHVEPLLHHTGFTCHLPIVV